MRIAVIGFGNGGRAFAGYLASLGHHVRVYARSVSPRSSREAPTITLEGAIACEGRLALLSNDLALVVKGCELVLVVTTADAHRALALEVAPHLKPGQTIVLNPGRTLGAIDFWRGLQLARPEIADEVVVSEAQSLVFACRSSTETSVTIVGRKRNVPLSALRAGNTERVVKMMNALFGCFQPARLLETSLENIGAVLHPPITLLNAAAIERGTKIYFYKDMTPRIAEMLMALDRERLVIAGALGLRLRSIEEWVSYAYDGVASGNLCEKMRRNPAYYQILAPNEIECRMLTEDVPTGLVPMYELGRLLGGDAPLMRSMIQLSSQLLGADYFVSGRTLDRLGLDRAMLQELMDEGGVPSASLSHSEPEAAAS